LREAVEGNGIEVEDKGFTVAVHFRRAVAPELARRRILHLASVMPGARVFGGHAVVNLAPIGTRTKADAIAAFAAQFPPGPLLFAGDDETDEDALRSPLVTHGIRVGRPERTAARYFLEAQADVDRLLWALVSEQARVAGLGDGWQGLDPSRNRGGPE
jgi:trehalose-phosphatase